MEHLPKRNAQAKPLFSTIPYLCQERYDEGSFLDYPHRLDMPNLEVDGTLHFANTLRIAGRQYLFSMKSARLQSFLQNWLFFGLLHEVLGNLYRHHDFITTVLEGEEERTIVSTANLLSRLEVWEANVTQNRDSLMAVYGHLATCLNLTYGCLRIAYPEFDECLKFHLASVAEVVGYAVSKACDVGWTDDPTRSLLPITWYLATSKGFKKSVLLERSNCCPSQVQMLLEDFKSPQALSFVASCFQEDQPHAHCDESRCRVGHLESSQLPRHVDESCTCKPLRIDEDLLVDCLKRKCLPLLRLKEEPDLDEMSIEVVRSTDSTSYVALSHVWADGLGNPTETALPRCQLSRVKAFINNLDFDYVDSLALRYYPKDPSNLLLWCDSLCCPVVSLEGKNMALRQMYRTYEEASIVLVLDQGLMVPRAGGKTADEACIRTATSRWMTRLWTLQEGALPARKKKLWFQFAKTALPARSLYDHIIEVHRTDISRRGVMDSVQGRFYVLTSLFDHSTMWNEDTRFRKVMVGLMYRSVTVPSDEPLLIATLLGLDLSRILASEPIRRMSILWQMIGTSKFGINKFIIFHLGAKIDERGFRWALQSLLPRDSHYFVPVPNGQEDRGFLTTDPNAKGLVVELAGLRVGMAVPTAGLPTQFVGFDSLPTNDVFRHQLLLKGYDRHWYYLKHRLHGEQDCPPELEEMHATISGLSKPWILYGGSQSQFPETTKGYHGILVETAADQPLQSKGITCVEIKSQVSFGVLPPGLTQHVEAAYCLAHQLAESAAARRCVDLAAGSPEQNNALRLEAFEDLARELERLARTPLAIETLAASGISADEQGFARFTEYIDRMYSGIYLHIEEYAPGNRNWCVD